MRTGDNFWAALHGTITMVNAIQNSRESKPSIPTAQQNFKEVLSCKNSKDENINTFVDFINSKNLKNFVKKLISDMYEFDFINATSVDYGITGVVAQEKYKLLSKIDLLEHSFGVINQISKIIGRTYGLYSDYFYLAALTHDFGKSTNLLKSYEIDSSLKHHEASAEYLRRLARIHPELTSHSRELLEVVIEVIDAHHSPELEKHFYGVKSNEDNKELHLIMIDKLKQADKLQRESETEKLQ